jgi:hypothetical protein
MGPKILLMDGRFWVVCAQELAELPEVYAQSIIPLDTSKYDRSALAQELQWCMSNAGESGKSAEFEQGFMEGVKQAMRLLTPPTEQGE